MSWMRRIWRRLRSGQQDAVATEQENGCQSNDQVHSALLVHVPDDVLTLVLQLLSHHDVLQLRICCTATAHHAVICAAYNQRSRLVIPPDTERNHILVTTLPQLLANGTLPTSIAVENLETLYELSAVHHHIQSLKIERAWVYRRPSEWFSGTLRMRPFSLEPLCQSRFDRLVDLDITLDDHQRLDLQPLDLQLIYDGARYVERLRLGEMRPPLNRHLYREFPALQSLTLKRFGTHRIDLGDIVGMPKLQELSIESDTGSPAISSAEALAHIRPLRVLRIDARWESRPSSDALQVHLAKLEELRLHDEEPWPLALLAQGTKLAILEADIDFAQPPLHPLSLRRACCLSVTLRELHLAWTVRAFDLELLATLTSLVHLTLLVHTQTPHYRPLRCLRNLETLRLRNGWLRDFVTELPRLRVLKCFEIQSHRTFCEPTQELVNFASPVRHAVIRWDAAFNPFAEAVLRNVEQLALIESQHSSLSAIWRLTKIKRLLIHDYRHHGNPHLLCELVNSFQSLPWIEELYLRRLRCIVPLVVPVGLLQAKTLRVLELHNPSGLKTIAKLATLERLYLRWYGGRDVKRLCSLHRLCEVTISRECCCLPLRRARGNGRALPLLQRIFHPVADCLMSPTCMQQEIESTSQMVREVAPFPSWAS